MKRWHGRAVLMLAASIAVATPVLLLWQEGATVARGAVATPEPLAPEPVPPVPGLYSRTIFAGAGASMDVLPGDAPTLSGIAGRLGTDAVAMVRTAEGTTRTLAIGESIDGWTLVSLSINAAYFTRGSERLRVAIAEE